MADPNQKPDLAQTAARLRPLSLHLLEAVAKAQARGLVLLPVSVAELAEYAKAVTAAIVDMEAHAAGGLGACSAPPAGQAGGNDYGELLQLAIQQQMNEAIRRVQSASPPSAGVPPSFPGTAGR